MADASRAPRISVVMPVYNAERYLRQALDSIATQSFRDFEIIVVDDGSTDESGAVLRSFEDKRLVYIRADINRGLVASVNAGIAAARGEFIARMDADDVALPDRFAKQLAYLDAHPRTGVVSARCLFVDAADVDSRSSFPAREMSHTEIAWRLLVENPIVHPTVMARTALLRDAGGYPADHPEAEDLALWMRLLPETQLAVLPDILLRLRKHESNVTLARWNERQAGTVEVVREALENFSGLSITSVAVALVLGLELAQSTPADAANAAEALVAAHATILARWPAPDRAISSRITDDLLDRLGVLQRRGLSRMVMIRLLRQLAASHPAMLRSRAGQRAIARALGAQWLLDMRAALRGASA